jgi:hypothetical protein
MCRHLESCPGLVVCQDTSGVARAVACSCRLGCAFGQPGLLRKPRAHCHPLRYYVPHTPQSAEGVAVCRLGCCALVRLSSYSAWYVTLPLPPSVLWSRHASETAGPCMQFLRVRFCPEPAGAAQALYQALWCGSLGCAAKRATPGLLRPCSAMLAAGVRSAGYVCTPGKHPPTKHGLLQPCNQ